MRRSKRDAARDELLQAGLYPGLTVRALSCRAESSGDDDGSVRWVLTTEKPATVWDWTRFDFVDEVLVADGMEVPPTRQVPFLDSHSRRSVDDILGSVSDFAETKINGHKAVDGLVKFADDEKSQRTKEKVAAGHLTDGSVGYEVIKSVWIPDGEEATVRGKKYRGPIKVSYRWRLKEFSATPIGADALAKVRSIVSGNQKQEK